MAKEARKRKYREQWRPAYDALMKYYPLTLEDLPGEIWKVIKHYEDYHCSNFGRVKSFKGKEPIILKPELSQDGYLCVVLSKGVGKRKLFRVNQLVGALFIPNPENKPEVNHLRGRFNNYVKWLEWATHSENQQHAYDTGLNHSGADNYQAGVTNEQAEYIRLNPDNLMCTELAEKFNVSVTVISDIQRGKRYKNVAGTIRESKYKFLPDEQRLIIRNRYAAGEKTKDLAAQFGVSRATIYKIIHEVK